MITLVKIASCTTQSHFLAGIAVVYQSPFASSSGVFTLCGHSRNDISQPSLQTGTSTFYQQNVNRSDVPIKKWAQIPLKLFLFPPSWHTDKIIGVEAARRWRDEAFQR